MATPLEALALVDTFSFIFPFLLVLAVVFGLLNFIKLFGPNKAVNGIVAVVVALMVLFSPIVRNTINTMAPWFVLLFFFMIFVLIAFKIFGFSDSDIMSTLTSESYRYINFWVIALVIIIGFGSLFYTLGQSGGVGTTGAAANQTVNADGSVASPNQESAFWSTLVHPKVLGLILIFLIGMFTVQRLAAA